MFNSNSPIENTSHTFPPHQNLFPFSPHTSH